ncbi:MAG: hypothetical protein WBW78_20870 [Terrimicrobiaceae bacterium]
MNRKSPIAKLPNGVHILKEGMGWRVRLGKKFTGGASIRKRFDTVADAREWIAGQANQRSHIQATALSPEQLAEAKDAFTKLNGTSLSEAVRFYLLHAKPAGGTKPLSEAIEAVLASKKAAQRSQTHIKHLGRSLKKFASKRQRNSATSYREMAERKILLVSDSTQLSEGSFSAF